MKTGFTCDSGYNVVASATRNGHKLIAVVLGETTGLGRAHRAANLLEHGFQKYDWLPLFATDSLDTLPIAETAPGPMTVRQKVVSMVCGTAARVAAKATKGNAQAHAPAKGWQPW
jgi:D-alanyl-D-alanine carboxypeptidase